MAKAAIQKEIFGVKTEIDADERTAEVVISTTAVDRDGEVVLAKGGVFENFMKNPVVLWAHKHDDAPIGRALWIKQGNKKITAKVKFAETEQAEEVYKLYSGGFLNAFSIGFISNKSHRPEPKEIAKLPEWANVWRVIDEWELLEFSAVPVPSNPEALAQAVKTKSVVLSDGIKADFDIDVEEDDEEIHYISDGVEKAVKKEPAKKEPEAVELKSVSLDVDAVFDVTPVDVVKVEPFVDMKAVVKEEIQRLKGRVY